MLFHGANNPFQDYRGSVSVIAAIVLVALFMMMTLLADSAAIISTKRSMQASLDIAALAGARMLDDETISDETIKSNINVVFKENLATSDKALTCDPAASEFGRDTGDVSTEVKCHYGMMLGGMIAPDNIDVLVQSKTRISRRKLDVALVLDVSGSMNSSGKLSALKAASKRAAQTLITASRREGDHRVSFVAYAKSVNVLMYGPYAWGDTDVIEPLPPTMAPYSCVSERIGDGAWDDRPPGPGAYFPFAGNDCPRNGLLTLSSDLSEIETAVDSLHASGSTAGHLGVAWAWYLLSPRWASVWPATSTPRPYDEEASFKVVILMSDGAFNNATHAPYGTSSQQAIKLCREMRNLGIQIYSVAFAAPAAGKQTLKACAGNEARYFEASSNTALIAADEQIAESLIALRIVE
nr:TadE/TadG family type IV pilus assembly protein [Hyphomonas sp. Mor2]